MDKLVTFHVFAALLTVLQYTTAQTIINPCKPGQIGSPCHDILCPVEDTNSFDWDELTSHGTDMPMVKVNMFVDQSDLTLNINVTVEYIVRASAEEEKDRNFGTTYVLDFEDFDAHKSAINAPNSCANRRAKDFAKLVTSSDFWRASDILSDIGNSDTLENMCYPPTAGTGWSINLEESDCYHINYFGKFSWAELRDCTNSADQSEQTALEITDSYLALTGTFYINMISPFWYENNEQYGGFYRVYQLYSQPFVIQVQRNVFVVDSLGVNVMTMSIIAVYKSGQDADYSLILLTETAEYMQLSAPKAMKVPQSTQFELEVWSEAETGGNCLNNKAFLCSQLWKVTATNTVCDANINNGRLDFGGDYQLKFTPLCRKGTVDSPYNFHQHCTDWLADHSQFKNGVQLESHLTFVDEMCESRVFTVELDAKLSFYESDAFITEIAGDSEFLFRAGVDTVYGKIEVDFPDDTYGVFDTELINVWLCTFSPEIAVSVPDQNGPNGENGLNATNGGCFNAERDDYLFHIYDAQQTPGVALEDFDVIQDGNVVKSDVILFSFLCPNEIARDTLYVHAHIEILLEELSVARRLLSTAKQTNKMAHFGEQISITSVAAMDAENNNNNNNLVPIVVGVVGSVVFILVGILLFYYKRRSSRKISVGATTRLSMSGSCNKQSVKYVDTEQFLA